MCYIDLPLTLTYETSHSGQLNLLPSAGREMSTGQGAEGNGRSIVALATHHSVVYPPTG